MPANLKALFRQVAMTRPNTCKIVQVVLISEGFSHGFSQLVSSPLSLLFGNLKKKLGEIRLYDWGLRAVKMVLIKAGGLLRLQQTGGSQNPSFFEQLRCVYSALVLNVESKLYFEHSKLFEELLENTFSKILQDQQASEKVVDLFYSPETNLTSAITQYLSTQQVFGKSKISEKLQQFDMLLNQRIGVAVIGPAYSGKSALIGHLRRVLQRMGQTVHLFRLNPRMFSKDSFFGVYHPDSFEFEDGAFVSVLRQINELKAASSNGRHF